MGKIIITDKGDSVDVLVKNVYVADALEMFGALGRSVVGKIVSNEAIDKTVTHREAKDLLIQIIEGI